MELLCSDRFPEFFALDNQEGNAAIEDGMIAAYRRHHRREPVERRHKARLDALRGRR